MDNVITNLFIMIKTDKRLQIIIAFVLFMLAFIIYSASQNTNQIPNLYDNNEYFADDYKLEYSEREDIYYVGVYVDSDEDFEIIKDRVYNDIISKFDNLKLVDKGKFIFIDTRPIEDIYPPLNNPDMGIPFDI
jgi:hypothetical protein